MSVNTSAVHGTAARRSLREILASQECLIASSVFDPVSARFARALGSEVGVMGGSVASHTVLGAPDIVLLTASELVEQARRICRVDAVNLIVDADHGYGNALNTMRTVQELQAAGVAAACVEDSVLPREFGASDTQGLTSIEEGVKKMKAAVLARGSGPMLVVARTNATGSEGALEAARRFAAYQETGVDALFIPYLKKKEELEIITQGLRLPLIVGGSDASIFDRADLARRGVKVWLWGHQPFGVAAQALFEAMKAVQEGALPSELANKPSADTMNLATDAHGYDHLTQQYLK
jgi:carboxyvinyl-carboxyphosphonate phosphorylmutase